MCMLTHFITNITFAFSCSAVTPPSIGTFHLDVMSNVIHKCLREPTGDRREGGVADQETEGGGGAIEVCHQATGPVGQDLMEQSP
jgi:hypothetical protein